MAKPEPAPRKRLIGLAVGEIRRLFNLADKDEHTVELGLLFSIQRRAHQARARRSHFRRRLHLQTLRI